MGPRIRTASLTGYADLARSCGLDPGAVLTDVGLDLADLAAPDTWVPAAPAARLLDVSARLSGCEDFGVRLAGLQPLGALGPLSLVIREEPDLRSALRLLVENERVYTEVLDLRLDEGPETATVQVWLEFGEPVPVRQALDLTTATLTGIIRSVLRRDWEPARARFAHPAPDDLRAFRRVFGSDLRFDQPVTGLVVPTRDLAAPLPTADPSVLPYALRYLSTVDGPTRPTTAARAREVVEFLLPLGRSSIGEVSRLLGVAPGTLRRGLAQEGENFTSVVHGTRARLAEHLVPDARRTLTDISQLLGFGAPSAFSRWFRQQFGMSPSAWRQRSRPS
jgi:AraC-like DNA-binding protein